MGVVIVKGKLTKEDVEQAKEDLKTYIKITIDIDQEIVVIGGEYHYDAEQILVKEFNSNNSNIWGGGYDIEAQKFETNALINLKPLLSATSHTIEDEKTRQRFMKLVEKTLKDLESLI